MPRIKNVTAHIDSLHDGCPLPAYETAEITDEDLGLDYYQSRVRDGLILLAAEPEHKTKAARGRAKTNEETAK